MLTYIWLVVAVALHHSELVLGRWTLAAQKLVMGLLC